MWTQADKETLLTELDRQGLRFVGTFGYPHGTRRITLTPKQAALYHADPDAVLAEINGVPVEAVARWRAEDYNVRCAGTLKSGKRCQQVVVGLRQVSPAEWWANQGARCERHPGRS